MGTTTTLSDPNLTQPAGYFTGATMRIRSINWLFDVREVTAYTPGHLSWTSALSNNLSSEDWGYFLDNKLNLLDAPGEWYFDNASHTLYIWAEGDADPNTLEVAATQDIPTQNVGIQLSGNYNALVDVAVEMFMNTAVSVSYLTQGVTIRSCTLRQSYSALVAYTNQMTVEDNVIRDTFATGIRFGGNGNVIARNTIRNIAMYPGFGEEVWGYFGIRASGDDNVIRRNDVDGVGYIGITFGGAHPSPTVFNLDHRTLVEENVIRHTVAILNDGGAIAFDNTDGLVMRRNLVLDTVGNIEAQNTRVNDYPNHRIAYGIYFGNQEIINAHVEDNVCARNASGIFVDHTTRSMNNAVTGNMLYDNEGQASMSDNSNNVDPPTSDTCVPAYNDIFTDNLLFANSNTQHVLELNEYRCTVPLQWGTYDHNRYLNPFNSTVVSRFRAHASVTDSFTLPMWQSASGLDAASSSFTAAWTPGPTHSAEFYENPYPTARVVAFTGMRQAVDGTVVSSPQSIAPYTALILLR